MQSKFYTLKPQAKIKTSGINRTTPGLEKKPNNVKVPININGRLFRDPRAADLVEIEQAYQATQREALLLKKQAEAEIKAKKDAIRQKEMDEYANKKLTEAKSKAEETN